MAEQAPRALVLTHTLPFPLVSGDRIRNYHLIRELRRNGWRVSLFALDPDGRSTPADRMRLEELCDDVRVEKMRPNRRSRLLSLLLFRPLYETFFYDRRAHASLLEFADRPYDVVIVEGLYMNAYVPSPAGDRVLLDAHNAETLRVESMARALRLRPRGVAAALQRRPLHAYERRVASAALHVTCVSSDEAAYFERLAPGRVTIVPNGVDCAEIAPRASCPADPNVLFVGSMDYSANVDAVAYLAREILPVVGRTDVSVTVIGSNPRREVFALAEQAPASMEILGYVADTAPHFDRSRVFAVPLRFGGGTRLKILEALARGIPVLTTSIGCEGLEVEHGRDLIVADEPAEFAHWLERLLRDDELCTSLAREGRAKVERRYDWRDIGEEFDAAARKVLRAPEYHPAVAGGHAMTVEGRRSPCG